MSEFVVAVVKQEFESHSSRMKMYLDDLAQIVNESGDPLEGNAFYYHTTLKLFPALYNKQVNLFWCGKQATTKICEIGLNAGHSSMLMLLGRDSSPLDYTIFDIGEHRYTEPSLRYLERKFQHIKFEYIEGDSTVTMPNWIKNNQSCLESYDVVHVDGGHSEHCISNDIKNANLLVKKGGLIIIDDTHLHHINAWAHNFVSSGNYRFVYLLPSHGYTHSAIQKI